MKFKSKILENASNLLNFNFSGQSLASRMDVELPKVNKLLHFSPFTRLPGSSEGPGARLRHLQGKFRTVLKTSKGSPENIRSNTLTTITASQCFSNPTQLTEFFTLLHTFLKKIQKIMVISICRGWSPSSEGAPSPEGETII